MSQLLILLPDRNTPGKSDFTGAFQPEAKLLVDMRGGSTVYIDQSQGDAARRRQVIRAIDKHQPAEIVYFGHGLERRLPQLGFSLGHCAQLAEAISEWATAPTVVLYACSAADGVGPGGDGGFADILRDSLCELGAKGTRVFAHPVAGHTSGNPFVRVFEGPCPAVGGKFTIQPPGQKHADGTPTPASEHWAAWRCCDHFGPGHRGCLGKGVHGPLRLRFPWLSKDSLLKELHHG